MRKNFCFIVGTRPEIIKLGPVYNYFKKRKKYNVTSYFTNQHVEIGEDVIKYFKFDIKSKEKQKTNLDLNSKMSSYADNLNIYLKTNKINGIFVLGDTLTAMIAAITAFNLKIKIFYVESGLRTYDFLEPWPEEGYRKIISSIADLHFCPTKQNKKNLILEKIDSKNICISGNPAIDAMQNEINKYDDSYEKKLKNIISKKGFTLKKRKIVLVTIHRRENFGIRFENICKTIKLLAKLYVEIDFVVTVHPNPYVKKTLNKFLHKIDNIYLIKALFYPEFIFLLKKSSLVMSDSGGIQEELPSLKKYLILLREKTERNETVKLGYSFICGSSKKKILKNFKNLINKKDQNYRFKANPFGNGNSAEMIFNFIKKKSH